MKGVLDFCNIQVIFKSQNKTHNCRFKDPAPQIHTSGVVFRFEWGLCNNCYYGECVRHFTVRSGEHICNSSLTSKRVQPRKD